jgi:hypothetical protein
MAFLDPGANEAESGPPQPPQGGSPPSGPAGGGPILAAIANRQRGPQVSAPGPGDMSNSTTLIMQAYGLLKQAIPGLQPGSPIEQDVMKITQRLSRHLPQGQPALGVQQTQLQDLLRNVLKNALLSKIMGQMKPPGQGAAGGPGEAGGGPAPPGAPPGAMAQAPTPSTPLPGA